MLLRGSRCTSVVAIATKGRATTTTPTTTLLLSPHRCCFLCPGVIGRGGSTAAAFCTAPTPGGREGMENKEAEKMNDKNGHGDNNDHSKKYEPHHAVGDTMWHSFGVGYGTRSDEEGFGGIYGRNDPIESPGHHANHPEYDKSQGSEVKEKEKARNLSDDAAVEKS